MIHTVMSSQTMKICTVNWGGVVVVCVYVCVSSVVTNFCDPMDCSPPGFSVYRIFQARILEYAAISFSRNLPNPGIKLMSLKWS